MSESLAESRSLLELSPAEREERGIDAETVQSALLDVIRNGQEEEKTFEGRTFPGVDLDYQVVEGIDNHPVVFRDCTFEGVVSLDNADLKLPFRFEGCRFEGFSMRYTRFEYDFDVVDATVSGPVEAYESRFDRDAAFPGVTFEGEVSIEESALSDDTSFRGARFGGSVSFRGSEFSGVSNLLDDNATFEGAVFESAATFEQATFEAAKFVDAAFEGPADFGQVVFQGDVEADGVTFEDEATFEEVECHDDIDFESATFEGAARFRGALFTGGARAMEDDACFAGATFGTEADFRDAEFRDVNFADATFDGEAHFEEAAFDGDAEFDGATFAAAADFDEIECHEDASFEGTTFASLASFRGAVFHGGARSLEDDVRFADARFGGETDFREVQFRYANFGAATFTGTAAFTETRFTADADFDEAVFGALANFEEAGFVEDADFSQCTFEGRAVFRGAEFRGHTNQLEDNATFENAAFGDDADFSESEFTSANFMRTTFAGTIDFTGASFADRIDVMVLADGDDPYVNFTDATIRGGTITQPSDGWVRYDLTRASLGHVTLQSDMTQGSQQLLDYFRFCETVFDEFDGNEFDFSDHTDYLDRNEWNLHDFADATDRTYAVEMTPPVVEATYLNAKNSASAAGDMKAAGEFRVKRQQYARRKHLDIAGDPDAGAGARFKNLVRAAENGFLGLTCGHGMRIFRIFGVFAVVPLFFSLLYAFGGKALSTSAGQTSLAALSTPEGQATLYKLVSFSYITFLTIGYGNIGPQGWAARILVAVEVYLSVILGGLVLYALIKRSEM